MNAPIVSFNHVGKSFDVEGRARWKPFRNSTCRLPKVGTVAIVGSSGCGKSTLLRLLVGLDTEFRGEIRVRDKAVSGIGGERGIVFQEHRLFPWLTVTENIGLGLVNEALSARERQQRIDDFIQLVGLKDFAGAYPHQLSGGMAQRGCDCPWIGGEPAHSLLDEPSVPLTLTRQQMQDELLAIRSRAKITNYFWSPTTSRRRFTRRPRWW